LPFGVPDGSKHAETSTGRPDTPVPRRGRTPVTTICSRKRRPAALCAIRRQFQAGVLVPSWRPPT